MTILAWKWLRKLIKKFKKAEADKRTIWPTAEEIAQLPLFERINPDGIVVITTKEGAQRAYDELMKEKVVGFDTESKPTFIKGQKSTGPHVAQFATSEQTYIFMLHQDDCRKTATALIKSPKLKKVGFGLQDDLKRIQIKLKIRPQEVVDIEALFGAKGYKRGVGVKTGVAIALKRQFKKSKSQSTSNWGAPHLTDNQLIYAANDAYAAIQVYQALLSL